jgi:hypothetical protein
MRHQREMLTQRCPSDFNVRLTTAHSFSLSRNAVGNFGEEFAQGFDIFRQTFFF